MRVIEIRSRQLEISTARNTHIMQTALRRWRDRTLRCAEDLSLGDSFRDVQEEDGLRRAFRHWRASARHKRSLQVRYDNYMRDTELNTLAVCMEKWLDETQERILAGEVRLRVHCNESAECAHLTGGTRRQLPAASSPQDCFPTLAASDYCESALLQQRKLLIARDA